ncbi:microsomal dipeptidase-like Zn-dependent dipeptidase [Rhodobacter viridis]|uniref:Microsomal dipeptidase-like Zn-dependent dipeptidase n=1 Tax=Rhodobacter viridis TaxID=1054202 RepID=A0A318TWZ0_9RHOB|nr:dipeptidase [Rhodobacter viridis]PYF09212.1 microsomal dipeptidase-like Zn-dependent dipeptidase [Rhodobacter viridis]
MGWGKRIAMGLGGAVILAAGAFFAFAPGIVEKGQNRVVPHDPWPVSERAAALHKTLTIGDWHSDALLWDRDLLTRSDRGHVDLPRLRAGNVAVQVFTTVTKTPAGMNYEHNAAGARDNITLLVFGQLRPVQTWFSLTERALDQAARLAAMADKAPDQLVVVRSVADLDRVLAARAKGAETVAGLLGAEGGHALEGEIENLDRLYDAGFRLIGLTHFFDNELGGSLHGEDDAGLTPFGRQVVAAMVQKHMVIDLAHASEQMAKDVLAMEGTRPIVSHGGIHGVCPVKRNFPDALMQEIAAKGGVIGIGDWAEVTCDATPAGVARSIAAAVALVGEDHVALGSDFDGAVETQFDSAELAALTQALIDAGLSEPTIAKVMGGNMVRVLRETLPQ